MNRINGLLSPFIERLGIEGACRLESIRKAWTHIFDGPLSLHMWPSRLDNGELLINVDSPVWLQQISLYRNEIIQKLRSFGVQDVRLRIGKTKASPPHTRKSVGTQPTPLDRDSKDYIEALTSEIGDPELKTAISRAIESAFTKRITKGKEPRRERG